MLDGLRPHNPGSYQTRELRTLGRYRHLGLLQYRDLDAYYCLACGIVYNVKCSNCGVWSTYKTHLSLHKDTDDIFIVERPLVTIKADGLYWTPAQCRKCDFRFRVIVR